jgi:hypothetical protein
VTWVVLVRAAPATGDRALGRSVSKRES